MVPQLDRHVGAPETFDQARQLLGGRPWPRLHQRGGDRPLPTPGEHQPMAVRRRGQRVEGEDGPSLLPAFQVGVGQHGRQTGIALGVARQHNEMGSAGIGPAGARPGRGECHLCPEDRRQVAHSRRLGKTDHTVETVMIGQGQRGQPEPGGLGHQLLGVAAAVKETEARVRVQLGIRRLSHRALPPTTPRARCRATGPPRPWSPLGRGPGVGAPTTSVRSWATVRPRPPRIARGHRR